MVNLPIVKRQTDLWLNSQMDKQTEIDICTNRLSMIPPSLDEFFLMVAFSYTLDGEEIQTLIRMGRWVTDRRTDEPMNR